MILPKEQEFIWNEETYKSHIQSVLTLMGSYEGDNWRLIKGEAKYPVWVLQEIKSKDPFNIYTSFTYQDSAIDFFMTLEPLVEL